MTGGQRGDSVNTAGRQRGDSGETVGRQRGDSGETDLEAGLLEDGMVVAPRRVRAVHLHPGVVQIDELPLNGAKATLRFPLICTGSRRILTVCGAHQEMRNTCLLP